MKNANPVSVLLIALGLGLTGLTGGCDGGGSAAKPQVVKTVSDYFPVRVGERLVEMQLACLPPEMARGLMARPSLDPERGMLFVYERPTVLSFYMRNTSIPLDIGYFDAEGVLQEVYPLHPYDERAVQSRNSRLQFALEVNQGWFARQGVKPGARLDLGAVAAALRARGLKPETYGLESIALEGQK